jgi:hypothetical protein
MQNFLKKLVKILAGKVHSVITPTMTLAAKSAPQVKINQRLLFVLYQYGMSQGHRFNLSDTGFRNFSQFEEDGILLYIFAAIGAERKVFVDIGAGDGINSNCANLAVNFGWRGLFIEGNPANIERGRKYYTSNLDTSFYPPKFVHKLVQRENINEIIRDSGFSGEIDLVSIDIDGNDYWIWDALTVVEPRVVIIETQIEFGMNSIVVPYDKNYSYPGKDDIYHGASPVAMEKLARKKGYRLIGANNYGFNTIYLKNGIGEDVLPAVSVESILRHPRNTERQKRFEAVKDREYVHV